MDKIFWLSPAVRFDERLRYARGMNLETKLCADNPEHTTRSRWRRPLRLIGPIKPMTDFEWTVYGDLIVDQAVAQSIRQAGFSGVEFLPVEFFTTTETPFARDSVSFA